MLSSSFPISLLSSSICKNQLRMRVNLSLFLPPLYPHCFIWLFLHVLMLRWNKSSPVNQFTLPLHQLDLLWLRALQSALQSTHHTSSVGSTNRSGLSGENPISSLPACELRAPASSAMSCFINKRNYSPDLNLSLERSKSNEANVAICCMDCSVWYQICEDLKRADDLSCFTYVLEV